MSNNSMIYKVTGILHGDRLEFNIEKWKTLITTQRYYEIKSSEGIVKRIYKEKIGILVDETKQYANGKLSCSAFCPEEKVDSIQILIIQRLQLLITNYIEDLHLNRKALEMNC